MGEYTVTGQIVSGRAFGTRPAFCRWGVVAGPAWDLLEGVQDGQTMTAYAPRSRPAVWSHPVEMRFSYKVLPDGPIGASCILAMRADAEPDCSTAAGLSPMLGAALLASPFDRVA